MFSWTTRRIPPETEARKRLERLIDQARADQAAPRGDPPADPEWIDESPEQHPPTPPPRTDPWWRRGRTGSLVERWIPGAAEPVSRRRFPVAVIACLVLGLLVAVWLALPSTATREPPPALPSAADPPSAAPPPADGGWMVVSVVGRVVRPGLVSLPDGARVADALQAAGGPVPGADLGALNIARRLTDGEQIFVGIPSPPEAAPVPGAPGKIDLNSASVSQLDTLPGVGTVTAERIVAWRTNHGRFTRVDQLREIDGIGPARFAQLKDLVVVR